MERRLGAFSAEFLIKVALCWAVLSAVLLGFHFSKIAGFLSMGPDDVLRLVQVRDLIAGQSWFDATQHRINAADGGVPMHWSRLVDLPLYLTIIVLTPIVGSALAETIAVILVPLITMGLAMMLAARIAWRLLGQQVANLTCLVFAFSLPVIFQLGPMRIDHHGWQIVCALAAVNGLMARSERMGAFIIGASLATWLSISIEGLPFAAAMFALLAWRWIRDRKERVWLEMAIQSLAGTSIALFLLTKGAGNLQIYCDAIGPAHLAVFGWGAIVLTVFSRIEPIPRGLLVAGFGIAGGGAIGVMFLTAPQCVTGGGFGDLDPLVAEFWLSKVAEGQPIWRQKLEVAMQFAVTPVIALFALANLIGQSRDWLRRFWTDYALLLVAAFIVSMFVARAGAVACVLAAPPLAWQIRQWLRAIRNMKRPVYRVSAMMGVACVLLPILPLSVFTSAEKAHASILGEEPKEKKKPAATCNISETAHLLNALPASELYAPLDIGPRILLDTHHSVVATAHHRGDDAMKFVIETALADPDDALTRLRARGTNYVVICDGRGEPVTYKKAAPDGFVATLLSDDAPDWLEPIDLGEAGSLKAWAIKPE
ncbi:hypothetical protein [Erythrobacter sp. YT30]|uniref:hypothetical protein n=1 Tax=Erythrobacter sp. YT30 TaxID=1735012 RepID=UPI00076C0A18|nr:hypothetical protein [Erythrobacter sp. YT30]KWV91505.1 hypothetical protein AUC45_09695 [Erythrobacter sp. YT30]